MLLRHALMEKDFNQRKRNEQPGSSAALVWREGSRCKAQDIVRRGARHFAGLGQRPRLFVNLEDGEVV
jgi:hypothetical protein